MNLSILMQWRDSPPFDVSGWSAPIHNNWDEGQSHIVPERGAQSLLWNFNQDPCKKMPFPMHLNLIHMIAIHLWLYITFKPSRSFDLSNAIAKRKFNYAYRKRWKKFNCNFSIWNANVASLSIRCRRQLYLELLKQIELKGIFQVSHCVPFSLFFWRGFFNKKSKSLILLFYTERRRMVKVIYECFTNKNDYW